MGEKVGIEREKRDALTIPNLAPIPRPLSDVRGISRVLLSRHGHVNAGPALHLQLVEVIALDLLPVVAAEVVVVHGRDAGQESLIKGADAVGGQEQYAIVVLDCAQEASDEIVARQVVDLSVLHVYVCFVEEHDGVPAASGVEPST